MKLCELVDVLEKPALFEMTSRRDTPETKFTEFNPLAFFSGTNNSKSYDAYLELLGRLKDTTVRSVKQIGVMARGFDFNSTADTALSSVFGNAVHHIESGLDFVVKLSVELDISLEAFKLECDRYYKQALGKNIEIK